MRVRAAWLKPCLIQTRPVANPSRCDIHPGTAPAYTNPLTNLDLLAFGSVFGRRLGAFAEEIVLHLLRDELLVLLAPGLQTVLVQQHLLQVPPLRPRLLADILVNPLPERRIERGLVEPFSLAA